MSAQLIKVSLLSKSPLNVRKTEPRAALEELKASILAHGLMQNLVVVPAKKGKFHVIAGARRLEAIQELVAEGKLDGAEIPCQVVTEEHALEMSIAENKVRHAMHPADEFEAFAGLVVEGQTAADIALRFGVSEKHVLQRLKLGRLAPELIAAYRAADLKLDALEAFTVTDDHARQLSVYKSLHSWHRDDARHIRKCLTESAVDGTSKLARFVGEDAYAAAGGTIRRDLFSKDVYFEQPALLEQLAADKLQAIADELQAEGWAWVETSLERDYSFTRGMGEIEPRPADAPADVLAEKAQAEQELEAIRSQIEQTEDDDELDALWDKESEAENRLAEVEQRLEAYAVFDPEEMKTAGCYVAVSYGGELSVEKGLVKAGDRKQADDKAGSKPKAKPLYSQALKGELETYRLHAAKVAVARNPEVAFDLLVFSVANRELNRGGGSIGLDVRFTTTSGAASVSKAESAARTVYDTMKKELSLDWLKTKKEADRFDQFRALSRDEKLAILAYCVADTLPAQLAEKGCVVEDALALTGVSVAAYWRPTKDNYLSRVSKDQLLDIGKAVFDKKWQTERRNFKKAALADSLHNAFADPDKHAAQPEAAERLRTWLPLGMAFKAAPAAEPAVAKPGRKKKAA